MSTGMFPSNRTLEVGSRQVDVLSILFLTFKQFPVAEDPFTDLVSGGMPYSAGTTCAGKNTRCVYIYYAEKLIAS